MALDGGPKGSIGDAADEVRGANAKSKNDFKRSFPKKRPVGRPRKDGEPAGSVPPDEKPPASEKVKLEIPPELIPIVALAPLSLAAQGMAIAAGVNPNLIGPNAGTIKGLTKTFEAWLKSLDFELTPGYALLVMYGAALSEMGMVTVALAQQKAEEKKKAAGDKPPEGAQGGPGPASSPAAPEEVPTQGPLPESVNGSDQPAAKA